MKNKLENFEPWIAYCTRVEIFQEDINSLKVKSDWNKMLKHQQIRTLLNDVLEFYNTPLKRHNDAKHPIHKLSFLSDIGLNKSVKEISMVCNKILQSIGDEEIFRINMNINPRYGGTGKDQLVWCLCDAPLLIYILIKFGYKNDKRVKIATNKLLSLISENGYRCVVTKDLGKFRGPGRKTDPCPYVNLLMLKMLSVLPEEHNRKEVIILLETIKDLWKNREKTKPYLFGMGTDFKKLKAPFIWYDILHLTSILSHFKTFHKEKVFKEFVSIINNKADENGLYTPESVYRAWKGFDFGQKKSPSNWLLFQIAKINSKINMEN